MTILDAKQRQDATDPTRSFLVQAPAGSGKTEMLSQRFLRLLSTVNAPEQIIALTFTRKAASEMRERIILALKRVAAGQEPQSSHQQQTHDFAKAVLAQDARCQWQILNQPARLKIMTLDALCQSICQAMPIQEKAIPFANITENADWYCRQAARQCIEYALKESHWQTPMSGLLLHLDNRVDKLIDLFADMLMQREQWMHLVLSAQSAPKEAFEEALALIERHTIDRFIDVTPVEIRSRLQQLAQQAACVDDKINSPREPLRFWSEFSHLDKTILHGLASLLLTGKDELRKQFDHHVGVSKTSCHNESLYQQIKEDSMSLLETLAENPDFVDALIRVKNLPPSQYDDNQWTILAYLLQLLPLLAAHLQVLFEEDEVLDFTAVSQQAISALGDEQTPTDLALYWDNSIHHLLIDEFQDTSIQQYQLIEKLVAGWQQNDGKTLFCVGDPMQSIYRFRQAEVGLFLRARYHGIGPVKLDYLQLKMNFRSCEQIVSWFNQAFTPIFPAQEDIELGAISFSNSEPALPAIEDSFIQAASYDDKVQEAEAIVENIELLLKTYPQDTIALLARSRNHLRPILALLREQRIPFQGVDMDLLTTLPHIQDVWSLTTALLNPANRLSWFALMRGPFCGIKLDDLLQIGKASRHRPIYEVLANLEDLNEILTEDGVKRARYFFQIMSQALRQRYHKPLSLWIWETFHAFQGPSLFQANEIADLEQYWQLLTKHDKAGTIDDVNYFRKQLDALYAQQSQACPLQVMTIHKSKGLEFDTVILPQLSATNANHDRPLLRWLKLPREQQAPLFLLAPIKASDQERCPLYDFLSNLDQEKEHFEKQRLLYVAITRSKKRLCLSGIKKVANSSFQSLLKHIDFEPCENQENRQHQTPPLTLYRIDDTLVENYRPKTVIFQSSFQAKDRLDNYASVVGSVVHLLLQQAVDNHCQHLEQLNWGPAHHAIQQQVVHLPLQQSIEKQCLSLITQFYACPTAQWLIKPRQKAYAEYPLLVQSDEKPKQQIIDLFFYDEDQGWWVIDYKTSSFEDNKHTDYVNQVNGYAHALKQLLSLEQIRCGVYYLGDNKWMHWVN
ncbi:UvrD-helicase domain-containing protein [Legionella sp. W05-934-2]|uniref:UvrD-helicase domain-containing protein n=1 Tax=Legionella sp. W05-934-2 TaxID=1198649 RepID=UPI003461917E